MLGPVRLWEGPSNVFWVGVRVVWEGFLEEVAVKLEPEVRVR